MQYVRSISGSVSKTWNSINPATLSGAIDVIVVEQEDGSLACSPFHIRFGKFSLLRPSDKKVEFTVNGEKQEHPMKLGEGGEAFFVFETKGEVPEALQTSPLVSPAASPELGPTPVVAPSLQEPEAFELEGEGAATLQPTSQHKRGSKSTSQAIPIPPLLRRAQSDSGGAVALPRAPLEDVDRPQAADFAGLEPQSMPKLERNATTSNIPAVKAALAKAIDSGESLRASSQSPPSSPEGKDDDRSPSPPPLSTDDARTRAMNLSKKLWTSNISNQVTDAGDLMLDMTGFKSTDGEALHAEVIARQLLSEEMDGPYDIGALIGADEKGNIWIYSSEEAKEAAGRKASEGLGSFNPAAYGSTDALSDPGYHSDDSRSDSNIDMTNTHLRRDSDSAVGLTSMPVSPGAPATAGTHGDPNKNYAKTLRLTTDQLKTMNLEPGANSMSFTVNRATCNATLWYWKYDQPIVISDIDGTITKSDVLGHVMTSIGRDWTHAGVAKLYTEIAANGYNLMYLTSRSVGQADTTRAYLDGVVQEGYKLPKGPVILSPDRLIAALRREIYLRKPELFKMACLRDIMCLFAGHGGSNNTHESADAGLHAHIPSMSAGRGKAGSPFYAGFGNRLTDALSYRSVNIPSTRIFTINSNSEISLDLLSLNKFKTAYSSMREIVDHYFPPVGLLVQGGGEEFTDFNYWRESPLDVVDFTDSDSESETDSFAIRNAITRVQTGGSTLGESIMSEDEAGDDMMDSYITDPRLSLEDSIAGSVDDEDEDLEEMMGSMTLDDINEGDEDGDDEEDRLDEDDEEAVPSHLDGTSPVTTDVDSGRRRGRKQDNDATPRGAGATARQDVGLSSRATTPTDSELSSGPD